MACWNDKTEIERIPRDFNFNLNVNSLQNNKELELLNRQFKAQVVFLTETKIDASYPNIYINRNDRVKGGGGVMA